MLPQHLDVVPQPMGDYQPVDKWQAHINALFHTLRGRQAQDYYQTFASADYRLAHAVAADYVERVRERDRRASEADRAKLLIVHEWGCGHGNFAACFLTQLRAIDAAGAVYPRVRYVLVDPQQSALDAALAHPDLAAHRTQVETICAAANDLSSVAAGTVDRIICNELWTELPTKLIAKNRTDVEEEHVRPNLSEQRHAQIADWSGFMRAFTNKDEAALAAEATFFEELIWEREYHPIEWKDVPYRKTIAEFLKPFDEEVLVPVNLGAFATVKEALRVLAPTAVGFSSFDAGATEFDVLNSREKPCSGNFGGLYSVMVNFALIEAIARHLGAKTVEIEPQREFIGRNLNATVLTLTDLLATHPDLMHLGKWQQDRLVLQTLHALNRHYRSPYRRTLHFPLPDDMPTAERSASDQMLAGFRPDGVPHTAAYLTESEVMTAFPDLEALGYERESVTMALSAPPAGIDYTHWYCRPQ
ncbi:MAG: hypothetical protein U0172_12650 [Nitrospiraceae bacterium]